MPSQVLVDLGFVGDFDPDEVSALLDLRPSRSHIAGEVVGNGHTGRKHTTSGWFLSTDHIAADEIEPHLDWLLYQLDPRTIAIVELQSKGIDGRVNCSWSSTGMGGGPWIAVRTMTRLGALGLDLVVSFYGAE